MNFHRSSNEDFHAAGLECLVGKNGTSPRISGFRIFFANCVYHFNSNQEEIQLDKQGEEAQCFFKFFAYIY